MARYRKTDVRTWNDEKFRRLSPIPPCGQGLWLWLLTGPRTTNIPGIVIGTEAVLAAELKWPLKAFREAFREALAEGMLEADLNAGLVWLKNATRYNRPESPNVVKSWSDTWDEAPECKLKHEIYQHLKAFTEGLGEAFGEAFAKACGKPSLNQEQEQDLDIYKGHRKNGFIKPTVEEVAAYCRERGNNVSAEHFVAFYESNGWKVGPNPMKDWRGAIRGTWEKNAREQSKVSPKHHRSSDQTHLPTAPIKPIDQLRREMGDIE